MPSDPSSIEKDSPSSISDRWLLFSVIGVGMGSLVGAFGISLGMVRRRSPDFSMKALEGHESPSRVAARALGWGTLLAFTGCAGLVILAGYITGASNPKQFGQNTRKFLEPKFKRHRVVNDDNPSANQ